ncbi:unnamed protein product [Eruca vesicaria subsp. sativa]|uniref:Uncharacterized protein n=1 Tax=Eruca vesicaria subsp. sativa TaxID=29727 RepID=A0ABC8LWU7_ERUVS|nr:unnamed protein product [Eruca vesicaria subsp. sativa]
MLVPGKYLARCKSLLRRARKRLALRSRSITCLDAKTAKHTNLKESLETAWRLQKMHRNGYGSTSSSLSVY